MSKQKTEIKEFNTPEEFYQKYLKIREKKKLKGYENQFPNFSEKETEVEFKNFYIAYEEKPWTLYNIDLKIPKNKIVAIIGPSGCGKSTLLRSINRMNEEMAKTRTQGEILIEGENIYSPKVNKMRLRTKVGMVFQKPQPFPRSIYENIAFGPKLHGIKKKEQLDRIVESSLQSVGLFEEIEGRLDDHAYGLSGGQQQRLCIARTIAVRPKIILADEPASALDPKSTYQIEDLLLKLKEDFTVVIVTHNMQQAARISDYSIFMYNGVVVEYNRTENIFEKPVYELTENYISGRFG